MVRATVIMMKATVKRMGACVIIIRATVMMVGPVIIMKAFSLTLAGVKPVTVFCQNRNI